MIPHEPRNRQSRNARFLERVVAPFPDDRTNTEVVGAWTLKPVGKRAGLKTYIDHLAKRRHFIWADSRSRAFSGYRNTILGNLWLILMPVLDGLFYYIIFGLLLQISRDMENYIGYLLIGIFMFQYTSRSLNSGATAVTGARSMIRAFTFPRASLPIAVVTRETVSMLPVVLTMAALILTLPPRTAVSWHWIIFPAILGFHGLFNLGIAFFAARSTARIPDLRHLISFLTRFWRYGSAVMFPLDRYINDSTILAILELNPLFVIIDMYRQVLLNGEVPPIHSWLLLAAWSLGTALLGFLYFWRAEEQYGRE